MTQSRIYTILGFIFLGVLSRFMPHPPNFTAINAIALLGASSLGSVWLSFITVFATLFFSDLVIGFYSCMPFVYLSCGLNTLLGLWFTKKRSFQHLMLASIASSVLFFLVSNLGVWLNSSSYPRTLEGLGMCYVAAIPFLRNEIFGTAFYSLLITFGYVAIPRLMKQTFQLNKI